MQRLATLELIGPGRWLDRPVVDMLLQMDAQPSAQAAFHDALHAAQWVAQTAVTLQRQAGHRIEWWNVEAGGQEGSAHARFETEDPATGELAGELVWWLLQQLPGQCTPPGFPVTGSPQFQERINEFVETARQRVFPLDAELLITAANKRDIPVCKLDREPYETIAGDFRRRPNGLLRFGHACHQQVVDGTLCLQRSARVVEQLHSRAAKLQFMRTHGAPVSSEGSDHEVHAGETWRFLCAGQHLLAAVDASGREVTALCHPSWLEMAATLAQRIETGMLVLQATSADFASPMRTDGAFTDLDISPRLDDLMLQAPELCALMAEDFVDWMFPPHSPFRVPLFSVTGTNGKTTTCRMLRAIAETAGYKVGMACTDGIYLDGELVEPGDSSGRDGHHRVLESRQVDLAVLETARGAVLHSGFTFDYSDVAVCTNVSAEHLGEYGIHTLEDMAAIKQLILSKARKAVVLNFDDALVRKMHAPAGARTCWTTLESNPEAIVASGQAVDRILHLSIVDGEEWIFSSEGSITTPLLAVAAIPATMQGKARHNLSNAMQAMAAALEMDLPWAAIATAMQGFAMSFENTPGRLNFLQGPAFTVLMDFVQNYACLEQLCAFTDRLDVAGKRIIVMSVLGRHADETIRDFARLASQSFDHFICRNYKLTFPHRSPTEIPEMLQHELLRCGVANENIVIELDEAPAIDRALAMAAHGDLVVVLCGLRTEETWRQLRESVEPAFA
jgi:UDP-N-acetylmuramyl tripeptide synthase